MAHGARLRQQAVCLLGRVRRTMLHMRVGPRHDDGGFGLALPLHNVGRCPVRAVHLDDLARADSARSRGGYGRPASRQHRLSSVPLGARSCPNMMLHAGRQAESDARGVRHAPHLRLPTRAPNVGSKSPDELAERIPQHTDLLLPPREAVEPPGTLCFIRHSSKVAA